MFLNIFKNFYYIFILLILLSCVDCWSNRKTYQQIASDFKLAFPTEMKEFRNNLSSTERAILQKIESQQKKYKNVEELTETIKNASPLFEEKFKKLFYELQQKMNTLSLESLTFVYDVGRKVENLFESKNVQLKALPSKELKNEYITKYNKLSQETKENLRKVLPMYDQLYKAMLRSN